MTRVSETLVVQRVGDEVIVFVDDSTGQEFVIPLHVAPRVVEAMRYLIDPMGYMPEEGAT